MVLLYGGLSAIIVACARQIMKRQRLNRSQLIKLKLFACICGTLVLGIVHSETFNQEEDPTPILPLNLVIRGSPGINFAIFTLSLQSENYALVSSNDGYYVVFVLISAIAVYYQHWTTSQSIFDSNGPLQFICMINCINAWVDLIFFLMAKELRVLENGIVTQEFVWNGKDWIARRPRNQHNGNHREEIMARRERRRSGI